MNSFKDTVTKTVQLFKLTHQDRWNEFKLSFSREQLEDLQVRSTSSVYLEKRECLFISSLRVPAQRTTFRRQIRLGRGNERRVTYSA